MESVFTTEDHDGDYDDFVSFNFDNYQSFISYFKLTKLINIFLFRLITWIMISIIVNEEICVGQEYPRSSTLKEIIRYSRIALNNSERKAAGSMFSLIQKIIVLSLVGAVKKIRQTYMKISTRSSPEFFFSVLMVPQCLYV